MISNEDDPARLACPEACAPRRAGRYLFRVVPEDGRGIGDALVSAAAVAPERRDYVIANGISRRIRAASGGIVGAGEWLSPRLARWYSSTVDGRDHVG